MYSRVQRNKASVTGAATPSPAALSALMTRTEHFPQHKKGVLVIFDLDGTLTDSCRVDDFCFTESIAEVLGIRNIDCEWSRYSEATDILLLRDIVRRSLGRDPKEEEIRDVRVRFHRLLGQRLSGRHSLCRPIRGARQMLTRLGEDSRLAACVATGSWGECAELKLRHAGLYCFRGLNATSSDAATKPAIMEIAEARAKRHYGVARFEKVVCVGDSVFDVRAARRRGHVFVGIGRGRRVAELISAGAICVFEDYRNADHLLQILSSSAR